MQMRFVRLKWENAARTIGTIYAVPDHPYYFTPGQYADISLPSPAGPMGRTMTLVSLPSDKLVGFTTQFDRRHSPYKQALLRLQPNGPLTITDAMGDLVLPLDSSIPLVFVAGGVAISSFVSMIRWLTEQKDSRDITLLYAVRSAADVIYTEVFDAYAPIGHLTRCVYTPDVKAAPVSNDPQLAIEHKRLTAEEVMRHVRDDTQIYLSGSENMVEEIRRSLQKDHGIPQYRIAFDYFDGYTEA